MKNLVILFISTIVPIKSYAWFNKPTAEDYVLQIGFIGLMIVDWKQTNWMHDNYKKVYTKCYENHELGKFCEKRVITHKESNPILSKHPSKRKIAVYFSSCIVGHTTIAYVLSKPYRNLFQLSGTIIELSATVDNYKAGVKIKF